MAFAFVSSSGNTGTNSASANTIVTSSFSVTSGQLLVLVFRWEGGSPPDTITGTLSDGGAGFSWSSGHYVGTSSGEEERQVVFYAIANSTTSITCTFTFASSATRTYRTWNVARFTYTDTLSLVTTDTAQNGSNVSTWSAGTVSVNSGDLVYASVAHYNVTSQPSAPSGYSVGFDSGLTDTFYKITSASGSENPSAGWSSGTESYAGITLLFRETTGGGGAANSYYYMGNQ